MGTETEFDEPAFVHQKGAERGNTYMAIESSRLVPMLVALTIVSVLAGIGAFGMAVWALNRADFAERQALVAKMRTEGFTRALIARGIDPYPHLQGEDP